MSINAFSEWALSLDGRFKDYCLKKRGYHGMSSGVMAVILWNEFIQDNPDLPRYPGFKRHKKIIFVSGAYTAKDDDGVMGNIAHAKWAAIQLWKEGWAVICPHMNTSHFEVYQIKYDDFIIGDFEFLRSCDAIYMLNNWKSSKGARMEYRYACWLGLEVIFESGNDVSGEGDL